MIFQIFTAVKFQFGVLWVLTPCNFVVGTSGWRRKQRGPPKCWYPAAIQHGVTTQKTST